MTGGALVPAAGLVADVAAVFAESKNALLGLSTRLRTHAPDAPAGALVALDTVIRATLTTLAEPDEPAAGPSPGRAPTAPRRGRARPPSHAEPVAAP